MPELIQDPPKPSHKFLFCSLALIILVGCFTYANSLHGQLVWDDESLVQFNPYIKDWSHFPKILTTRLGSIAKEAGAFYRPVQTITYLVDYSFWKLNVVGYHTINIAWHILAALSVFGLIQMIFQNAKVSLVTALLFVTHPIHTEAVAYVSGRADSLVTFFMISAFILYLKHEQKRSSLILGIMAASFLLALLSKEYSLILPPLIWFYHYTFKRPVDKKAFTVVITTLIVYALWRLMVVGVGTITEGEVPTFFERLPGVFVALTNYFRLMFLPFDLHMEYGGILFNWNEPKIFIGIVLLALLIIYTRQKREQDRLFFFSVGWFFIALIPNLNLFFTINAYMAEHWLYVPSIGFCLIVARFLVNLSEKPPFKGIAIVFMTGLILFYAILSIRQNRIWNNNITFYKKMLEFAPESSRLYNNLAKAYHDAGKNDELIDLLKTAIAKQPENALAHNNLGNALKESGKYKEAVAAYRNAIKIDPTHAGPYYNLSTILSDIEGRREEAKQLLNKSIEMSPYFSKSYTKLGIMYLQDGDKDKAIVLMNQSLKLNPDDPEIYHNIGYVYMSTGDIRKAVEMYQMAIKVNPNYVEAYHDLAVIYYSEGNHKLAVQYCDKAVSMGLVDQKLLDAVKPYR